MPTKKKRFKKEPVDSTKAVLNRLEQELKCHKNRIEPAEKELESELQKLESEKTDFLTKIAQKEIFIRTKFGNNHAERKRRMRDLEVEIASLKALQKEPPFSAFQAAAYVILENSDRPLTIKELAPGMHAILKEQFPDAIVNRQWNDRFLTLAYDALDADLLTFVHHKAGQGNQERFSLREKAQLVETVEVKDLSSEEDVTTPESTKSYPEEWR